MIRQSSVTFQLMLDRKAICSGSVKVIKMHRSQLLGYIGIAHQTLSPISNVGQTTHFQLCGAYTKPSLASMTPLATLLHSQQGPE